MVELSRLERLRLLLEAENTDALVVTTPTNIRYLTGFTGSNGFVVVSADGPTTLVTDRRYEERAAEELTDSKVNVKIAPGAGFSALGELCADGLLGLEADHVSWELAESLRDKLGAERIVAASGLVEKLREHKDAGELNSMREAARIADVGLAAIKSLLGPGATEIELARHFEAVVVAEGAEGTAFDTIVASGPNGSRPHHRTGDRQLEVGDLVIIDSGAKVDGYRSDMTRSFVIGSPTPRQSELLDAVARAQAEGVAAVAPGVPIAEIDTACRRVLDDAGLLEFFSHGTGHGVGLDIHEAPSVNGRATDTLAPGHVITVEPGVYLPGEGGVRWEDTVVVTETGAEPITLTSKEPFIDA